MADILRDPRLTGNGAPLLDGPVDGYDSDLPAHQRSYHRFSKIVTFAVLHVASVLAALALVFLGHATIFGLLVGLGVNFALIVAFAVTD